MVVRLVSCGAGEYKQAAMDGYKRQRHPKQEKEEPEYNKIRTPLEIELPLTPMALC